MSVTEAPQSSSQGLDLEAFERFCEFAESNRADVQFELEAVGEYEGRAVHTHAGTGPYGLGGERIDRVARRYSHHFGAHREVEEALGFTDPTDREEVIEVALAALTGCINAAVSISALARGIELERLTTEVSVGWDPSVLLHLAEPGDREATVDQFGGLAIELTVSGDGLTDEDLAYLQASVRRSAVFNLISIPHASTPVVKRG